MTYQRINRSSALLVVLLCLSADGRTQQSPAARSVKDPGSAAPFYRNTALGFRYRLPYGWVDRSKEMQEGNDTGKGEVLLAVFERPPQATGDTINSAVVIAAEKSATYPGLKKAEDYLDTLTELTSARGFKADGDPLEIEVDLQKMVRANFSRALNDKLTMHQSTLVLLSKGQIVTFTFIAESADAVDNLIEGLSFLSAKSKAK